MNHFYDNLKYIRNKKKMSMLKFGEYINQTSSNISRWENGKNGITINMAKDISDRLGYDIGDLVNKDLRAEEYIELMSNKNIFIILDKIKDLSDDDLDNINKIIDLYLNK